MTKARAYFIVFVILMVMWLAGCASTVSSFTSMPTPITQTPAKYTIWYAEMSDCLKMPNDFNGVTFYVTDNPHHNNHTFNGYWEKESRSIVLYSKMVDRKDVVVHEMIHDITRSTQHTNSKFNSICGNYTVGDSYAD